MKWLIAIAVLAASGVGYWVWRAKFPPPVPITESELIGVWKIASITGSARPYRIDDMDYLCDSLVSLRPDHTLTYRFVFARSSSIHSGKWSLSDDHLKVRLALSAGPSEVLEKDPRTGLLCHHDGSAFFPCEKISCSELPRKTNPPIKLPVSRFVGLWKGQFVAIGHAPTTDPHDEAANRNFDLKTNQLRFVINLRNDGTFTCDQGDESQFPPEGTWKYVPKLGLIELNRKEMGTATQDLLIDGEGRTLVFAFAKSRIEFTKLPKGIKPPPIPIEADLLQRN